MQPVNDIEMNKTVINSNVCRLMMAFALFGIFMLLAPNVGSAQTACTNCTTDCGAGGTPCCNIWNACNYNQSLCYYGPGDCSTIDPDTGCDLACTPIDSGVLFLLLGGAAFGGVMIMRRRQEALEVIKH